MVHGTHSMNAMPTRPHTVKHEVVLLVNVTRNPHTHPRQLFDHEPVGETGATIRGAILDLPLRGSRPRML
eukprot:15942072-Heterocapsa_arctica.AAC.1